MFGLVNKMKMPTLDDCLAILSNGYIRGGGGFLKTGGSELLKGSGIATREVRIGVSQVIDIIVIV